MDFSFGIVTDGKNVENIKSIIDSINDLHIKNYEIIIVGGDNVYNNAYVRHIPFVDNTRSGEISKKKNIITIQSKYENIVYIHDYICFLKDWYSGFIEFGNDFEVCMTKIFNLDNSRYRDWCLWLDDARNYVAYNNHLIPYHFTHLSKLMYISGAYWIAKKDFMLKNMLNEKLSWGQGEDVEWSIRARQTTDFKINTLSGVKLLKYKDRIFNETNSFENNILKNIKNYDDSKSYEKLINKHLKKYLYESH
jgi:hypothetical protein